VFQTVFVLIAGGRAVAECFKVLLGDVVVLGGDMHVSVGFEQVRLARLCGLVGNVVGFEALFYRDRVGVAVGDFVHEALYTGLREIRVSFFATHNTCDIVIII
jgi:hypothetical protein